MNRIIQHALSIFRAGVRSVEADILLGDFSLEDAVGKPLPSFERVFVIGAGKASMAMAGALERLIPEVNLAGKVVIPHGYSGTLPTTQTRPSKINVIEGGHPAPERGSVRAANSALEIAKQCGPEDLLLILISGGGSALWCAPPKGISLEDLEQCNRLLLHSGAPIHEVNAVRKHLSRIKGGRLAVEAFPATSLTMIISDVPEDDLSVIASGPTVPDLSSFWDAKEVLTSHSIWEKVPRSVRRHIRAGMNGHIADTPSQVEKIFRCAKVNLLGTNQLSLDEAAKHALELGYKPSIQKNVSGEARLVGEMLGEMILRELSGTCLLWGGETTVTVSGDGLGGRNHEVALSAAIAMAGKEDQVVVFSGGTDGVDGPTGAAGAWATPQTVIHLPMAIEALNDNNSFPFLDAAGSTLVTGPTHTNVMDIMIALKA